MYSLSIDTLLAQKNVGSTRHLQEKLIQQRETHRAPVQSKTAPDKKSPILQRAKI